MSHASDIVTVLDADSGVGGAATLLTGGIYTFDETGRLGINRDDTPTAFDGTTGLLKPCAVVKTRAKIHDGGIHDDQTQEMSYRQVVEIWLYADGNAGYSTLESAQARIFTLLNGKRINGALVRWVNDIEDERAPDGVLDNASLIRDDYEVHYMK